MARTILSYALGSLVFLMVPSPPAQACALRGPARISIDVFAAPATGAPPSECRVWEGKPPALKGRWWLTIGDAGPAGQIREGVSSRLRCGTGPLDSGRTAPSAEIPYLVATGSAAATLQRQIEDDPLLVVEITLSIRKLLAVEAGPTPRYAQFDVKRRLHFTESRDALVPLLVATTEEARALGIHEVFARVAVTMDKDHTVGSYGAITITSGAGEADILLDGGVAGRTGGNGAITLRNVPTGLRGVSLRDRKGGEARTIVRVAAGRTSLAHLAPDEPHATSTPYRLTPLGTNAQGYEEYRRERDGALVVRVPAGEFLMVNKDTERAPLEHQVYVSDFLIDKTAVTWAQFKRFAQATGVPLPPHEPYWGTHDDHPAVFVTWEEARNYCAWVGGRLPTEAEREKAARGTDARKYPWGNEEPDPQRAVFRRSWGHAATDRVGIRPSGVSPYGIHDLGGNVWEWCSDWHDDGYYAVSPVRDPKGPASGQTHVVRGGSWDSRPTVLSSSCRNWGHLGYREGDFGFRCAMNDPE